MPGASQNGEFMLTIYLDQLRCNKTEDLFGDEFVIAAVSQSGRTRDQFEMVNRTVATPVMKTSGGGRVYPFPADVSTLFAARVEPTDYVLVSLSAMDLDFAPSAWNSGMKEIVAGLAEAAKRAAGRAFEDSSAADRAEKSGNLVDGDIVESTAKIFLELVPGVIKAAIKVDQPDTLGKWFPQRDKCRASDWRGLNGEKIPIPFKGGSVRGQWDYELTLGIRVE
jgi:hypothetical protein